MTDFEPFKDDKEAMDWIEENADWGENPALTRRNPVLGFCILLTAVIVASILALIFGP